MIPHNKSGQFRLAQTNAVSLATVRQSYLLQFCFLNCYIFSYNASPWFHSFCSWTSVESISFIYIIPSPSCICTCSLIFYIWNISPGVIGILLMNLLFGHPCHFETKERKCKKFLPSLNNTEILFGKFFLQESTAGWSHQIWSPTIRAL